MTNQVVAIDGPAASGKTTVARLLAIQLGALFFDTGVLYRAVTLLAIRAKIDRTDGGQLGKLPSNHMIDIQAPSVLDGRHYDVRIDGSDVTWAIREPEVDMAVSEVSAHSAVRASLLPIQRRIAAAGPVVMVGRDVGSVVVPDASVKVYLDASVEERSRRRFVEARERGGTAAFESILADLRQRDTSDASRVHAPLTIAADAIRVDTDGLSVVEVVSALVTIVHAAWTNPTLP